MTVKKNDWVSVEYTGKIVSTGELFDTNKDKKPLDFKVGLGMVIPGFDNALIDMKEGEEKEVTIKADQAYGQKNTQEVELPKASFQDTKNLEEGKEFVVNTNFGPMLIEIKEIKEETIKAILNHPLAGKDLLFNIKLLKIFDEKETKEKEDKLKEQTCASNCSSCKDHESCSENTTKDKDENKN
jgi:FKBP-type peptidyl-prolyl cis-trans isomerase 2